MNWEQRCYIVISDSVPGMSPLLHGMKLTQWEAFQVVQQSEHAMPAKLRQNLRVVSAYLSFNDGEAQETDPT